MSGTPGRAVTRDGRGLYYVRGPGPAGGGAPTVVFEAGLGSTRSGWALVERAVARRAPTVVYDRANLGRSDRDPQPRHLGRLADDLVDLLVHLGAERYVLVGTSWGGPVIRIAAAAVPGLIHGLVLVDPSDEGYDGHFSPTVRRAERVSLTVMRLLARAGLLRTAMKPVVRALPPDARADVLAEETTPAAVEGRAAELGFVAEDLGALRDDPPELGDIPVTIISGARNGGMGARVRQGLNAAHARRAGLSPYGRHVLARRSGHLVVLTEPDLVTEEIERLLP
ncbi:alpha/beta fold hydrolase [Streptosporangium saharense]|uniref:alpha/beta fold hydrolase n=1 Tax=Streptosporangium saharense TaxID=1706840 RepID=UPI0036C40E51